jgi:hypothetical protein
VSDSTRTGSTSQEEDAPPHREREPHLRAVPTAPGPAPLSPATGGQSTGVVAFNREELREILNLYGRKVAAGEWRDYAIDFNASRAVFSIFRRTSEMPLYRIEKDPKLARKQGAYSVVAATGLILKRGHELARVISVLDKRIKLVAV